MTATTPDRALPPRGRPIRRPVEHHPATPTSIGDELDLTGLTVRQLIEQLARTEEQLNLGRLESIDEDPTARRRLLRRQRRIIRELRRRST